jgi:hypothetical protein
MLEIEDQGYERVKEFKFLETVWTKDNAVTTEIKQQKIMPNKTSYGLKKQLSSPNLECRTKCVLHKTYIRLTHGNEGWPLSKKDRNMLQSLQEEY